MSARRAGPDIFATAVLREMDRRRWSILDLAEHSGVDRWTLGKWLRGDTTLRTHTAERVLAALDLTIVPAAKPAARQPRR